MAMMSCEQATTLLHEKIDGVIGESDNARLEAHLARCETCRHEYEALKKTQTYLNTLAVEVPPQLSAKVMERIEREPKWRAPILRRLRPLVALPAVALLCVALLHSPLFDGMFVAKEVADMSEAINNAGGDWNSSLSSKGEKPKHDGILEDFSPEEVEPSYASIAITGTSLTLRFTDEQNALLVYGESGKSEAVTYSKHENIITIEKNGKEIRLVLADSTLTLTDKDSLDALLAK